MAAVMLDLDSGHVSQAVASGGHDVLLQCFADEVGADAACLIVREGIGEPSRLVASWDSRGRANPDRRFDGEFLARLLESDGPILEPDDDGASERIIRLARHEASIRHAIGAVARTPDGVEAILCAGFGGRPRLERAALLWTANSFAVAAGLCLTDAGGLRRALTRPCRDPLTGCLSYAELVKALRREIERSVRQHYRLSCCFLDLDGFGRVNNTRGHMKGNDVLAGIGGILRDSVRTYDTVGRFGGDEFVIILPETSARSAGELAERLRDRLRTTTLNATSAPVEASIGTAEWVPGMSAEDLLETADRSLRVAKENGGSRVVNASSPNHAVESVLGIFECISERRRGEDRAEAAQDRKSQL